MAYTGSWGLKSANSLSQKSKDSSFEQVKTDTQGSRRVVHRVMDSDSEVEEAIAPKPSRSKATKAATQRRAPSPKPTRATRGRATQSQKKSQPLFIESDDDEDDDVADANYKVDDTDEGASQPPAVEDDDEDVATLRSNPRSQPSRTKAAGKKRNIPVVPEEDSDDELAFRGFGAQRTGRRR